MAKSLTRETDAHLNYTKLCRLLYDGGTLALRTVFDGIVPPASLAAKLATEKPILQRLKRPTGRVLISHQWDLLYPSSGIPSSENFDITLLFVLLRNICGLTPPFTGWDALPLTTDTTREANLVRIKYYRNTVTAHLSKAAVEDIEFEAQWKNISTALVSLGVNQDEIDKLKSSPLGEKNYNKLIDDWSQSDKDIKDQLHSMEIGLSKMQDDLEKIKSALYKIKIEDLKKIDYDGCIKDLCEKYHPSTRKWIFERVNKNVRNRNTRTKAGVVLLSSGPGMGKSVVAAQICKSLKQDGFLGGCHFFQYNDSSRDNPRIMLQSIARQLCDSVKGYKAALEENLKSLQGMTFTDLTCQKLFEVLLEEPLKQIINKGRNVVIVIDALDECSSQFKKEIEDVLKSKLSTLPTEVRFVITTRHPIKFTVVADHIEIRPSDANNQRDLKTFFSSKLPKRDAKPLSEKLINISDGVFLIAHFICQPYILDGLGKKSWADVVQCFPHELSSVFKHYFERVRNLITPFLDTSESENSFYNMLKAVAVSESPVPKEMFYKILRLKSAYDVTENDRKKRNDAVALLHTLFPVENEHVTVFLKSAIDWLKLDADKNPYPQFSVSVNSGVEVLSETCLGVLQSFKEKQILADRPLELSGSERFLFKFGLGYIMQDSKLCESWKEEMIKHSSITIYAALISLQRKEDLAWRRNLKRDSAPRSVEEFLREMLEYFIWLQHVDKTKEFYFGHWLSIAGDSLLNNENSPLSPEEKEKLRHWLTRYKLPHSHHAVSSICSSVKKKKKKVNGLRRHHLYKITNGFIAAIRDNDLNILTTTADVKQKRFARTYEVRGISPDKKYLIITPSRSTKVELYDVTTLDKVQEYNCPIDHVDSCHIFGDAKQWYIVAKAEGFPSIAILNGSNGEFRTTTIPEDAEIMTVSQCGKILIGRRIKAGDDIIIDKIQSSNCNFTSADGETSDYDLRRITFYNSCRFKSIVPRHCSKFSDDGNYLAVYDGDSRTVLIFHTNNGELQLYNSRCDLYLAYFDRVVFLSSSYLIVRYTNTGQYKGFFACFKLEQNKTNKLIYCVDVPFNPSESDTLVVVPPQGEDNFIPALYFMNENFDLVTMEFYCLNQTFLDDSYSTRL